MGVSVDDVVNSPQGKILILSLVAIPICILVTVLRVVATWRLNHKLGWDDGFAVMALLGFLVYAGTPIVGTAMAGNIDDDYEIAVLTAKLAYIGTPFFFVNQLFARGSLIVLYHRIFWSDRAFVRWIYLLAAVHVSWFIAFFFTILFLCTPVSKWWDVVGDQPGWCISGEAYLVAEEGINSLLDFAVLALAIYVVQKVMTKTNIKRKLAFIFAVGGLSGVIGFIKIGLVYNIENTAGQENDENAFWDILQMTTSVLCTCAPMYRTMLPLGPVWNRIKLSTKSWARRSRGYYWTLVHTSTSHSGSRSRRLHTKDSNNVSNSGGGSDIASHGKRNGAAAADRRDLQGSGTSGPVLPFYIGGAEAEYTWSQFDKSEDILLPIYKSESGTGRSAEIESKPGTRFEVHRVV